jgi:hypothetical protein
MNREEERLIQRATPLVFGIFGQAERAPDQREVRFGGRKDFHCRFSDPNGALRESRFAQGESVSGGPDDCTYVATLWPLCLVDYEYPDLGGLVQTQNFSCLFDSGVLRSPDWPHMRQRIEKRNDEHGRPYPY